MFQSLYNDKLKKRSSLRPFLVLSVFLTALTICTLSQAPNGFAQEADKTEQKTETPVTEKNETVKQAEPVVQSEESSVKKEETSQQTDTKPETKQVEKAAEEKTETPQVPEAVKAPADAVKPVETTTIKEETSPPEEKADPVTALVQGLTVKGFAKTRKAIRALAQSGSDRAAPVLNAMKDKRLYFRKDDKQVFIIKKKGGELELTDAVTGKDAGVAPSSGFTRIKANNRLRKLISSVLGSLTLLDPDPAKRLNAAEAIFKSRKPAGDTVEALDEAIKKEKDSGIKQAFVEARAATVLKVSASDEDKLAAIKILRQKGGQDAMGLLKATGASTAGVVAKAALKAAKELENQQAMLANVQNVIYGLSLGSVLLLAAIGLAITFGVMGVINMAHGEMVMIGAYTTFVIQEIIRTSAPYMFDYSLFMAIPMAFLVAGAVGIAIERGVIRFLYGRPLETLLATWGISLILQQAVRTIFGPTNREVGTPSWMSGAVEMSGLTLTYNRLVIIVFSLIVFLVLLYVLKKTYFGLQMRAVTQNRSMAASMGISARWIDSLTFGLGSGIAGIAGVALSQIDNVSPNLGQSYIIDSFMVVVFGGVGNLWGTLVGAFSLGIANKFLEPYAGAVLGKILVLVFIILFIQKRPRGLFALKGRAVDA